jgi:hypothetical protein
MLHTFTLTRCKGSISEAELSMVCARAPHPFALILEERLHKEVYGGRIEDNWRLWGTPQVTVKQVSKYSRSC